MTVFHKAWAFLKATRQTELGEFHPEWPSSHGPMTMIRYHPQDLYYQYNYDRFDRRNPKLEQAYEKLIHEGLKALPVSEDNLTWEKHGRLDEKDKLRVYESKIQEGLKAQKPLGVKDFDLEGAFGNFFYPSGISRTPTINTFQKKPVGVRFPISQLVGQFRNRGYHNEPAEAFIEENIDPKYLVYVPDNWRAYEKDHLNNWMKPYQVNPEHPFEMGLPKDWGERGE